MDAPDQRLACGMQQSRCRRVLTRRARCWAGRQSSKRAPSGDSCDASVLHPARAVRQPHEVMVRTCHVWHGCSTLEALQASHLEDCMCRPTLQGGAEHLCHPRCAAGCHSTSWQTPARPAPAMQALQSSAAGWVQDLMQIKCGALPNYLLGLLSSYCSCTVSISEARET